ncbi:alpha-tocopherol transfer protein-like isoform X1 [Tubulanus polymorphus]|uniref:alpha-tocopherol transfer protein-like isoform X1 n=1 Tax=Tubulanus polymorphus TaxID=672921 RepID=UPI003DA60B6D
MMATYDIVDEDQVNLLQPQTLSIELQKKAYMELNEKAEWRSRDIQALRDMVIAHPGLTARTDDAFLLRFLRARKFDYDRAFKLLVNHYKIQKKYPEIYSDFRPSTVKHVFDDGIVNVLPSRDRFGCRILVQRPGLYDAVNMPYSVNDAFKATLITLEKLVEEEETQINGIQVIVDLTGVGWPLAKCLARYSSPSMMVNIMQDAFPMRVKGVHHIHEPKVFGYIFNLIKPFLKEKLAKRIHFHRSDLEKCFYNEFPREILPRDIQLGGYCDPLPSQWWTDIVMAAEEEFEGYKKHCLDEVRLMEAPPTTDELTQCGVLIGPYMKLPSS